MTRIGANGSPPARTRLRFERSQIMSRASKIRFAPTATPMIAVAMAGRPLVALNPSQAPMRPPLIAAANPAALVLGDQSRFYPN